MIVGWVIAAVVILMLISVLVSCFFKRRRRQASRRDTLLPTLGSEGPHFLPSAPPMSVAATTQVPLSSNSCMTIQTSYKYPQSGPQQLASRHTAAYTSSVTRTNPTGAPLPAKKLINAPSNSLPSSTAPPNPAAATSRRVNNNWPGMPLASRQGRTTNRAPPGTLYTDVAANRVPAQIPHESGEEGAMSRQISRQMSTKSAPPPYSPGVPQRDEDVPPLPNYGS